MDKRKPTYDLDAFRAAFSGVDRLRATTTAICSAAALGFDRAGIVATIQTMRRSEFYKAMTSFVDHRLWQDVYHVPPPVGMLYIKFTADTVTEFLLLSFRERTDD